MKKLTLFLLLSISFNNFAQQELTSHLNWLTDLDKAKTIATKEHKPIMLFFTGSDWCPPCKMLKEDFFSSAAFQDKADKMVLVLVDMPRRVDIITETQREKNKKLVQQYNRKGSYPNLVALNNKGKVIGELSGYTFLRETTKHTAFVDAIIENY